jgi:6-phosphofructokinase 1
MVLRGW